MKFWRLAVGISFLTSLLRASELATLPAVALYIMQFGVLLAVGVAGLLAPRTNDAPPGTSRVSIAYFTLVALAVASSFASLNARDTLAQVGILAVMGLFLTATLTRRWSDPEVRDGDLRFLFWSAVVAHLLGLAGHFASQPWAFNDYGRYQGLMYNPNYAGMSAAMLLPLVFHLRHRASVGGVVLAAALLLSGSRGAFMAALVALALVLVVPASRARAVVYGWVTAVVCTLLAMFRPSAFDFVGEFFSRVQQGSDFSSGRFDVYRALILRWEDSRWVGIGYREAEIISGDTVLAGHNIYLSTLVEVGILGFAAFAVMLLLIFMAGARRHVLVAPAVAVMVIELTESSLFGFGGPTALTAWLLLFAYASTGTASPAEPSPKAASSSATRARRASISR